ncbi:methionine--tRNA ligase subunit beta [Lachnospiraceae bacterium WCA-693-APC-MOT-I]|uniref:Methionine--tRNA ligase n=1 Tax=Velocimicrobium porci TaxID=2606634 RepID=A0A6L5XVL8_9FIRM|nr:methionine--tRNA ligase subunit beta [Velocimicrobium porci]
MNTDNILEVTYEEFINMDFRVGEIIACEEVKKSRKLLCFQVRVGEDIMQIVSGVKDYYTPEEVVGKKVMVLVNLKPATLAGLTSEGMILSAEDKNGKLSFMVPERDVEVGAEIC